MPTQFVEVELPRSISEGSKGGPGFATDVFQSETGFEQRNSKWARSRAMYDISYGIRQKEDMDAVLEFFYNMRGKAIGFRYFDWADFQIEEEVLGSVAGVPEDLQVIKKYTTGSETYTRTILKIIDTTYTVFLDAVALVEDTDYTIDIDTGIVSYIGSDTGVITITCHFNVPVRFDIDQLGVISEQWLTESTDSITLVEIKPIGA